jgi:endo-1,4-beta-xylanase
MHSLRTRPALPKHAYRLALPKWLSLLPCLLFSCVLQVYPQTLRQEADHVGLLVGTAVNPAYLSEPAYASTLAQEFNTLEPEDAMKWTALRPDQNTFDFSSADRIVQFAEAHGMKIRGHSLLWGIHNPSWLAEGRFTPRQLRRLLHRHIATVVGRYRGKVFAWDVVNEAFDENGQLRDSFWYNRPGLGDRRRGTAYIEQAFRWAHAADPQALLFYNEAGAEAINRKSDAVYAMVKDFKQRGVPIDGVGLQMHLLDLRVDPDSIAANITRFAQLGVQVHITEMDVALSVDGSGNPRDPSDLQRQAQIYREVLAVCVRQPACSAFQTWGFTDKYSWIPRFTNWTKGAALLFDRQYHPKPAYIALEQLLSAQAKRR